MASFKNFYRDNDPYDYPTGDDPIEGELQKRRYDPVNPLKNRGYIPRRDWEQPVEQDYEENYVSKFIQGFSKKFPQMWCRFTQYLSINQIQPEEIVFDLLIDKGYPPQKLSQEVLQMANSLPSC